MDKTLRFVSAYIENGFIYFLSWNANGIFRGDITSGKVKLLTVLPKRIEYNNYIYMKKNGDRLYLSPCHNNSIIEIEASNFDKKYEYLTDDKKTGAELTRYGDMEFREKNVYFYPFGGRAIMEFDTNNKTINYYNECYSLVKDNINKKGELWFKGGVYEGNKMWFVSNLSSDILCFDTISKQTTCHSIDYGKTGFRKICFDGSDFWLLSYYGSVLQWNPSEGIKRLIKKVVSYKPTDYDKYDMCVYDNRVWIAGSSMYECYSVDISTGKIQKEYFSRNVDEEFGEGQLKVMSGKLFFLPDKNDYLYRVETDEKKIYGVRFVLEDDEKEKYLDSIMKEDFDRGNIVIENEDNTLASFIRNT